jgi:hypothetical protein
MHPVLVLATKQDDVYSAPRGVFHFNAEMTIIQAQNYLASLADEDSHLCPTCDDVQYIGDAIITAENMLMDKFDGDGVIGFNVINMRCNDDAFMLIGRKFYKNTLGRRLFNPEYWHFYADTELGALAKSLGKFSICDDANMINYHPVAGYPEDATHTDGRREKLDHDRRVYDSRVLHR